jgi:DNA-binding NarL/FixJ family response regulator
MRVYVIAAYPTVRAGLAALVRDQPGWQVVGQAAPDALPRAATGTAGTLPATEPAEPPDVLLADLDGVRDGETLSAWLAALRPGGGLVALEPSAVPPVREAGPRGSLALLAEAARVAAEQGAGFGALRRDATEQEVVAALRAVATGLVALDRRLAEALLAAPERLAAPAGAPALAEEPLTSRELEVLQLLAEGLPNKTIAQRLHISEHTVKFHVSAIMTKLGAASRTEAVTQAARRGLLLL